MCNLFKFLASFLVLSPKLKQPVNRLNKGSLTNYALSNGNPKSRDQDLQPSRLQPGSRDATIRKWQKGGLVSFWL